MAYSLSQDYVRLHVIASSDEAWAQNLKMRLVIIIRRTAARLVCRAVNAKEAFEILKQNKKKILRAAKREAKLAGYFGHVDAECGVFAFPECNYGEKSIPKGDYRAMRVSIGEAKGHNWWCVLYPELCCVDQTVAEVLLKCDSVNFFSSIGVFFANLLHGVGL